LAADDSRERLDSWKAIAVHLGRDVRTVQRWEKSERLPIHRKLHDKLSSVYGVARIVARAAQRAHGPRL
jgi:hypothetical protein